MKNTNRIAIILFLGIVIFISLGCQLTSQATSTPESEAASNSESDSSPQQAPTETQSPKVDISSAVLTLDDLPPGFEELNSDELGIVMDDFNDGELQPEEIFIFMNSQDFQMVFGFNFLLTKSFDRAAFDMGISQPEITLPAFIDGMGSENVQNEEILEGFDDVGEKQIGMTMVADMEGIPVQVDVLMFRRDVIGAMLMSMVLEGETPNIALHELGLQLDQRMHESMGTTK
jgi:hypothetical protein